MFSHPEGLGLGGKEKPFIVPSSGQLFLGKLPPSLRLPSLSNTFDPVKHTQHWNNQIQHTCNTKEQPHATKSHCDWYLLPATEELPAWWAHVDGERLCTQKDGQGVAWAVEDPWQPLSITPIRVLEQGSSQLLRDAWEKVKNLICVFPKETFPAGNGLL